MSYPNELPFRAQKVAMTVESPDDELFGIYQDEEWASLFPRSNGWVALGPNSELFALSMFHQLHCLDSLRYGYATAKAGVLEFPGNGTGVEHHVHHCLTYLRQMVMCSADTTLEKSELTFSAVSGKLAHGASGSGMMHRCKDWTQIRRYAEENFDGRLQRGEVKEDGEEIL